MDSDSHSGLLSYRSDLTDEVCVVIPQLFFGVLASVSQRPLIGLPIPETFGRLELECASLAAGASGFRLARPDAIGHMGVGNVANPRLAGVPDVLLQPCHLRVTARQVQSNLFDVPVIVIRDVPDLQASGLDALL